MELYDFLKCGDLFNSKPLGIILPQQCIKKSKISAEDKVKVVITAIDKKNAASRLWAALPKWKTPSDELEKFVDKEFDLPV